LQVGYSHPVVFTRRKARDHQVETPTRLTVRGADKAIVAGRRRDPRGASPEPYKGKGIKYEGEHIRRKAGKAAGAAS
jgi:large subunit ribosomal protein L6